MAARRESSISYIQRVCLARLMARNRATSWSAWISSTISVVRARSALLLLLAATAGARVAAAQVPGADSLPRRVRVNPAALRPSELVYQITLERDAGTTII